MSHSCSTTPRISLRSVLGSISAMRFMSSRSTKSHVDMALERFVLVLGRVDLLVRLASSRRRGAGGGGEGGSVGLRRRCRSEVEAADRPPGPGARGRGARGANGLRPNPFKHRCRLSSFYAKKTLRTGPAGLRFRQASAGPIERAISRKTWCGRLPLATSASGTPFDPCVLETRAPHWESARRSASSGFPRPSSG